MGDMGELPSPLNRASEVEDLIDAVKALIVPYIRAADNAAGQRASGQVPQDGDEISRNVLVEALKPQELVEKLKFSLPDHDGQGRDGLLSVIQDVLRYSVNTWDQGFLDKLYSSNSAVGVVADMILATLNTNVHVYQVSPALTVVEKQTTRALARLFGFTGPRAGGFSTPGGSGANLASLIAARNTAVPSSREHGLPASAYDVNGLDGRWYSLFASEHSHYSIRQAAAACGLGSASVVSVPVDSEGRMDPAALRSRMADARAHGATPLYVCATAGTTVLGAFDPLPAIAEVCRDFDAWLHVDASWGGGVAFSASRRSKLAGTELANSVAVCPHKMLGVPLTCSFLLCPDTDVFRRANSVDAGYLFHNSEPDADGVLPELWDLADMTLQCGRRGDSLKLALAWIYHGAAGLGRRVDGAFELAAYLAGVIEAHGDFELLSTNPPPCLQVCFYHAPRGTLPGDDKENTRRTREMVARLMPRGFMVDYAPGPRGSFFRVVVNGQTLRGTVDGLVRALEEVGKEVDGKLRP